jgi:hypothetical protein
MTSFFKADVPVAKIPSEVPVLLSQKLKR